MDEQQSSGTQGGHIERTLKTRHLTMIALGGSIGTGLFIASGSAITTAGPGGALIAYAVMGVMVYFLMTSLAEMATYIPLTGSFAAYASKFVSPATGFALGWNYWFNAAITVPVEITTVGLVMNFWLPHVPAWVFSGVAFILIFIINYLSFLRGNGILVSLDQGGHRYHLYHRGGLSDPRDHGRPRTNRFD